MTQGPVPISVAEAPTRLGRLSAVAPREAAQGVVFILPAIVILATFLVYPVIWTTRLSFYRGRGLGFEGYLGFDNYKELFTEDPSFLDYHRFPPQGAVINNLKWMILYTGLCLVFGLALAVLAGRVRYERLVKAVVFVPMAISATAVGVIWLFVYSPDPKIGILNAVGEGVAGVEPISWVGREDTVNYAIIVAYVWFSAGFAMVVLSAALKGIPAEIVEAARVDGAGEWKIFRRILVPMISLPVAVVTVWLVINVIKVFDIVYIMTRGGPGASSRVIGYSMVFETFTNGRGGYGAAIAVVMLLLIVPIMLLNIRRFRSERVSG
jgi:alpha-glucoside transport system permease protein